MNNKELIKLEPLWGNWFVSEAVGRGKDFKVFSIYSKGVGSGESKILKWMQVKQENSLGGRDHLNQVIERLDMEKSLNSSDYIAGVEEYSIMENNENKCWDVIARMERLKELGKHFDKNPIRYKDIINILESITKAIKACNLQNIVHQDIKESNILVDEDGKFLLGDFSIAVKGDQESEISGSLPYISPEQYRGDRGTHKSDLYALGMTLYKLLNKGRMPFLPAYPKSYTEEVYEKAIQKRLSGEKVPKLETPITMLNDLIESMTAFHSEARLDIFDVEEVIFSIREDMKEHPEVYDGQSSNIMLKDQMSILDQTISIIDKGSNKTRVMKRSKQVVRPSSKSFINLDNVVVDYSKVHKNNEKKMKDRMSERIQKASEKEASAKLTQPPKRMKMKVKKNQKKKNPAKNFMEKMKSSKVNAILEYGSYVCIGLVITSGLVILIGIFKG